MALPTALLLALTSAEDAQSTALIQKTHVAMSTVSEKTIVLEDFTFSFTVFLFMDF